MSVEISAGVPRGMNAIVQAVESVVGPRGYSSVSVDVDPAQRDLVRVTIDGAPGPMSRLDLLRAAVAIRGVIPPGASLVVRDAVGSSFGADREVFLDPDGNVAEPFESVPGTIVQIDPDEDARAGAAAVLSWLIRRGRGR